MVYATIGMLEVASPLAGFVTDQLAPGTGVEPEGFWAAFGGIVERFRPQIQTCRNERDDLQARIDTWHKDPETQPEEANAFLRSIGYLVDDPGPGPVTTSGGRP